MDETLAHDFSDCFNHHERQSGDRLAETVRLVTPELVKQCFCVPATVWFNEHDVAQETFIVLCERGVKGDNPHAMARKAVQSVGRDMLRKEQRRYAVRPADLAEADSEEFEVVDQNVIDLPAALAKTEAEPYLLRRVLRAFKLGAAHWDALLQNVLEGRSYSEIVAANGEFTDLPGTVQRRIKRHFAEIVVLLRSEQGIADALSALDLPVRATVQKRAASA